MNTNAGRHAEFYATFDNDNLTPEQEEEVIEALAYAIAEAPQALAVGKNMSILLTEDRNRPVLLLNTGSDFHEILAYRSRVINPVRGQREALFVSRVPSEEGLWFTRDIHDINFVTRQFWLNETLAVSAYLRHMARNIASEEGINRRKLVRTAPRADADVRVHYHVEGEPGIVVIQSCIGDLTTWEMVTAKGGVRPLRTVNPEEGR